MSAEQQTRIELNPFELDRATYASIVLREQVWRYRGWLLLLFVLVAAMLAKMAWDSRSPVDFMITSAPTLVFYAVWLWLGAAWLPRWVARHPRNRFIFGAYRVVLAEGRLEVDEPSGARQVLPLDRVVAVSRSAEYLLLYSTMSSAVMIPRAAFRSGEDEAAFEAELSRAVVAT